MGETSIRRRRNVFQNRFVASIQAAVLGLAATGCAGLSTSKSNSGMTPLGAQRPGVVKQLTSAVSESKLGKSVSLAYKNATKKTTHKNNPTALINGVEPTNPGDYVALGESLEQNDDGEGVRRMFHKVLELEPHNLDALVALGATSTAKVSSTVRPNAIARRSNTIPRAPRPTTTSVCATRDSAATTMPRSARPGHQTGARSGALSQQHRYGAGGAKPR